LSMCRMPESLFFAACELAIFCIKIKEIEQSAGGISLKI
jgi:hypothetical protein